MPKEIAQDCEEEGDLKWDRLMVKLTYALIVISSLVLNAMAGWKWE